MTKLKLLVILSSFSFIAFANQGSGDKDNKPPTLKGVIVEAVEGAEIEGAVISLEKNGQVLQSVESDENGSFQLQFNDQVIRRDQVTINVYKKGYKTYRSKPISHTSDTVSIHLERIPEIIPVIVPLEGKGFRNLL